MPTQKQHLERRASSGAAVVDFGRSCLGCATNRNLAQKFLGEFYSGRGTHRLTRLGEEAFSRLHFVQPSSSPSRVKRSLPLTTKSFSEKSPNFLETAICRAPQVLPAGQDFVACRDQFAGNDTMQAAILSELRTRFALRRKSFPAERTYSNNHSRLHPSVGSAIAADRFARMR